MCLKAIWPGGGALSAQRTCTCAEEVPGEQRDGDAWHTTKYTSPAEADRVFANRSHFTVDDDDEEGGEEEEEKVFFWGGEIGFLFPRRNVAGLESILLRAPAPSGFRTPQHHFHQQNFLDGIPRALCLKKTALFHFPFFVPAFSRQAFERLLRRAQ